MNAACLAPNGVRRRNPKEGNFVVTSLNLGIVRTAGEQLELVFAPRSSVESLQEETLEALDLLGLEGCGRAVRAHTEAAKAAVADWDTDGFLAALADSLAERNK